MSLFACDECESVENTALAGFFGWWGRKKKPGAEAIEENPKLAEVKGDGKARCSACNPEIGRWHGHFERKKYDGSREVNNR